MMEGEVVDLFHRSLSWVILSSIFRLSSLCVSDFTYSIAHFSPSHTSSI